MVMRNSICEIVEDENVFYYKPGGKKKKEKNQTLATLTLKKIANWGSDRSGMQLIFHFQECQEEYQRGKQAPSWQGQMVALIVTVNERWERI